eukprot:CAMPEP_0168530696 /NCGR_PEP_ID=MMETSP0405-20121227/14855_1 /TAXON_ID=498012 /ORGANISM="Trichosphaerium sp, Strain Am-I-7 wt" /LENGTH=105 /DNA_ID=CAMNT_0008555055 /DNA_START=1 /DNA_END=315 /DNA_ORIENTATION=-
MWQKTKNSLLERNEDEMASAIGIATEKDDREFEGYESSDEEDEMTYREMQREKKSRKNLWKKSKQLSVKLKEALSDDLLPKGIDKATKIRMLYRRKQQKNYKSRA